MKISTKGRYAIRILLDLADNNTSSFIPLKDIAARQDITIKYMEQIISILNKGGYVMSQRGNIGGYKLAKEPGEYKIGDILRLTEGTVAPVKCVRSDYNTCQMKDKCKVLSFWKGFHQAIDDYVDSYTLEDLMANDCGSL